MEETLSSKNTYTKQQWIVEQARKHPDRVFTSLHHLIDIGWMFEAYRRTRKDGAIGIDGVTGDEYEKELGANLDGLQNRIKSGRCSAPPVRRHYIPKADGTKRALGIPTFEDKVAQRAILMLLEPIYETDFLSCSYGFRPGRSAHDALYALRTGIMEQGHRWVVDADIPKFFDSIDHGHLRSFLDLRIKDGVVRRQLGHHFAILGAGTATELRIYTRAATHVGWDQSRSKRRQRSRAAARLRHPHPHRADPGQNLPFGTMAVANHPLPRFRQPLFREHRQVLLELRRHRRLDQPPSTHAKKVGQWVRNRG